MKTRPPAASRSMRTGTVRTAGASRSSLRMRRSDDAGGAATSDGASARGGAGMNDDGRGFSPWVNHVAETAPPDETRVRGRRARFFSATGRGGGTGLAATFGGGAAGLDTIFARAAGF